MARDPSQYRGRHDEASDGPTDQYVDVRIAVSEGRVEAVREDVVRAFAAGDVKATGDEGFFIRFMPELLALVRQVSELSQPETEAEATAGQS